MATDDISLRIEMAQAADRFYSTAIQPRTDQQIVDEANELAQALARDIFGFAFADDVKVYDMIDPRMKKAWDAACLAIEHLQATPVQEALENVLATPSSAYDVEVTLTLTCVVRGPYNEEEARQIGRRLADATVAANECLDGSAYGVPEVTEFTINDARQPVTATALEE